jgi:hypothetical protein
MATILTACALITVSSALYLYYFHRTLASRIHHASHYGKLPPSTSATVTSIPEPVYSEDYYTVYDHAARSVTRRLLPSLEPAELFTQLVRRNMSTFARFPQAWTIWMITPSAQCNSFRASHFRSLDFREGDVVCGLYRVVVRTASSIEFEFMPPAPVKGRLVLSFREQEGSLVYASQTVMWKARDDKTVIHLERPVRKFMHEMAAWWLLDSGVRYLMDLDVDR